MAAADRFFGDLAVCYRHLPAVVLLGVVLLLLVPQFSVRQAAVGPFYAAC